MENEKILYSISIEDVVTVSKEIGVEFNESDIRFIQDKISDFMGSTWHDAVEQALKELMKSK